MLRIADKTFESHLFTGTGKFAAPDVMVEAIRASGSQLVTLAMKTVLEQRSHKLAMPSSPQLITTPTLWQDRKSVV